MVATFTYKEILELTSAKYILGNHLEQKGKLSWNVKELNNNDWFVVLKSTTDEDIADAISKGIQGIIVSESRKFLPTLSNITVLSVQDTKLALLKLANHWRESVGPKVVAVSGSKGRRTTIRLIEQFLSQSQKLHLSFLDQYGWKSSVYGILSMPSDTDTLIVEVGGLVRGDVHQLSQSVKPDIAVICQVSHPISTPEREERLANLYLEVLDTLSNSQEEFKAIIHDGNSSVRLISKSKVKKLKTIFSSKSEDGFSEQTLKSVNDRMRTEFGLCVSKIDLWCASKAALALGLSQKSLNEQISKSVTEVV